MSTQTTEQVLPDSPDLYPIFLDPNTKTFTANGTTYHVQGESGLSVERDRWLEKFTIYATLGRDSNAIVTELREIYALVSNSRNVDAGVKVDNLLKGVIDINQKYSPLYYICTLFINRTGENRKAYDADEAAQKIEDWNKEGIERSFFLSAAIGWLTSTGQEFARLTQSYSELGITPRIDLTNPAS